WERHWSRKGRLFRSPFTRTETNPYPHSFRPGAPYCGESLVEDLRSIILAHRPTLIIGPHAHDSHIDPWATHNFLVYTVEMLADEGLPRPDLWFYLTHRGEWPSPRGLRPGRRLMPPASLLEVGGEWLSVPLSPRAVEQKKIGLRAYRTQVA